MDSPRRSLAKALSWQTLGIAVSTAIGTIVTGDASAGLRLALALAIAGGALYTIHERVWERIRWGRAGTAEPAGAAPSEGRRSVASVSRTGLRKPWRSRRSHRRR